MRAVDIIAAKRDGLPLTDEQIIWFVDQYSRGELPDYQAAALLMAITLKSMTHEETAYLTQALVNSGEQLHLDDITDYAVDKHSSGGVGDKTSLVVLPLVAAMGVPVAKMSGRGLGFTGGTLDKMESVRGFNVNLTRDQFRDQARHVGLVLSGQTSELAPADGKLYALRDVTATVSSIPLIASSIMSKKIASGAKGIVLDVKVGEGAFMRQLSDAMDLARTMVDIGTLSGRDVIAVLSDMNQPLGLAVGNAIEVQEALETLNGAGPDDFRKHCLVIATHMVMLAGRGERWTDESAVYDELTEALDGGKALRKLRDMVLAQGGDVDMIDDPSLLPQAPVMHVLKSDREGYISRLSADKIGTAAMRLGAGREKKGDAVNHSVGLKMHVKVGDQVTNATPLITLYAMTMEEVPACLRELHDAIEYVDDPINPLPLHYGVVRAQS